MTTDNGGNRLIPTPSRRTIVTTGLGAAIAAPAILKVIPVNAQSRVIKIGHVSPRTGPLAAFGEADPFVLDNIGKLTAKGIQAQEIVRKSRKIPSVFVIVIWLFQFFGH